MDPNRQRHRIRSHGQSAHCVHLGLHRSLLLANDLEHYLPYEPRAARVERGEPAINVKSALRAGSEHEVAEEDRFLAQQRQQFRSRSIICQIRFHHSMTYTRDLLSISFSRCCSFRPAMSISKQL